MSHLNQFRFLDSNPVVREIAFELYSTIKDFPILSPHGHVDPQIFALNQPFSDPSQLLVMTDHYVLRMLYSQGISLDDLGIPRLDGTVFQEDRRKIWQVFADHYQLFAGTPTGIWMEYELKNVFNVELDLSGDTATDVYDHINSCLKREEFLPRNLFDAFNIEVLCTTDAPHTALTSHQQIHDSDWNGNIKPSFRPDSLTNLGNPNWLRDLEKTSQLAGFDVNNYSDFIKLLENRREYFKLHGAIATDHDTRSPYTHKLSDQEASNLFEKALKGISDPADTQVFMAHMLMEMARMSRDDGLVMQLHAGSWRNHNQMVLDTWGVDMGGDIPVQIEYTENLKALLNTYGNDPKFKLIVFTLDESSYTRELAPLAGHYPGLKLGPAWWFNDSIQGMTRYREQAMETGGIYNTVGFNDDTRTIPSIPARHDLSRRIDSNYLAGLVSRHIINIEQAIIMSKALAYDLVKTGYNL